jgi:hypothetical protein
MDERRQIKIRLRKPRNLPPFPIDAENSAAEGFWL